MFCCHQNDHAAGLAATVTLSSLSSDDRLDQSCIPCSQSTCSHPDPSTVCGNCSRDTANPVAATQPQWTGGAGWLSWAVWVVSCVAHQLPLPLAHSAPEYSWPTQRLTTPSRIRLYLLCTTTIQRVKIPVIICSTRTTITEISNLTDTAKVTYKEWTTSTPMLSKHGNPVVRVLVRT